MKLSYARDRLVEKYFWTCGVFHGKKLGAGACRPPAVQDDSGCATREPKKHPPPVIASSITPRVITPVGSQADARKQRSARDGHSLSSVAPLSSSFPFPHLLRNF
ncbi:hypothetical protein SETIT_2G329000v2 [Setaria italica]|uniref:Uncharacterized protein n=1 Tax=Setaria italica TaxID=4555 RepID=A0A368Q5A9_SETIT|nr:hypothetical protein SETIT_2G329000v2 [Setaria italica]